MALRYQVASGVVSTSVDGEITVLDPRSGVYFGLEEVAARVWVLLEARPTLQGLVDTLITEFDVGPDACRSDVAALLDDLGTRGLIEARNG